MALVIFFLKEMQTDPWAIGAKNQIKMIFLRARYFGLDHKAQD